MTMLYMSEEIQDLATVMSCIAFDLYWISGVVQPRMGYRLDLLPARECAPGARGAHGARWPLGSGHPARTRGATQW